MANEIHQKTLVSLASLTVTSLNSLADGDLMWFAPITTLGTCEYAQLWLQMTAGTSPTAGGTFEVYRGAFDGGSLYTGTDDVDLSATGTETTAADVARVLGTLGSPIAVISVDATSGVVYTTQAKIWQPEPNLILFGYNATGAALAASGHAATILGRGPEVQ